MPDYDRTLIAPGREELERALREAVAAANRRARTQTLAGEPPEGALRAAEAGGPAEGWWQWNGGAGRGRAWQPLSLVGIAWWTDRLGRRHVRVLGRRRKFSRPELNHLLDPEAEGWPALAGVYPDAGFLAERGGQRSLVAVCACGAFGPPPRLGWMGDCCGPCHDRREEGGEPARTCPAGRRATLRGGATPLISPHFLAFSPDAHTLAVSTGGGTVRLWDVRTGEARLTLTEVSERAGQVAEAITCLAFAPDGRHLWTGSRRGQVTRWDTGTGRRELLVQRRGWVHAVAVSPDGALLAVADAVTGISCWELPGCAPRPPLSQPRRGNPQGVERLAFSPDGAALAAGYWDGEVRLWDVTGGAERPGLRGPSTHVHSLSFSADGRTLAVGFRREVTMRGWGPPHPALLWDTARGSVRLAVAGDQPTLAAALTPDGRWLLTGDEGRRLRVWDARTGAEALAVLWHRAMVCAVALAPGGRTVATCGLDGTARLWPWEALRPEGPPVT
jgi:hypothetical protein